LALTPLTRARSLKLSKCGEVYMPTLYPAASRMLSSMAQVEPLPLVPPTTMRTQGSDSAMRSATWHTRSRPRSMALACRPSRYASQSSSAAVSSSAMLISLFNAARYQVILVIALVVLDFPGGQDFDDARGQTGYEL